MVFAAIAVRANMVGHSGAAGLSGHAAQIYCRSAANGDGAPAGTDRAIDCAGACSFLCAPGLVHAAVSHLARRRQVTIRLPGEAMVAVEIDAGPADLRSRAPPLPA